MRFWDTILTTSSLKKQYFPSISCYFFFIFWYNPKYSDCILNEIFYTSCHINYFKNNNNNKYFFAVENGKW